MMTGATRAVFLIGRWALKVPRWTKWNLFLHGLLANMQEVLWARSRVASELAPVIWAVPGGFFVLARRARPLTDAEWDAFDYEAFHDRQDLDCILPVEDKRDSFGVLDGRIVAVDYG